MKVYGNFLVRPLLFFVWVLVLPTILGTPITALSFTDDDSVNVILDVDGCNNNSVCEPSAGENATNCANDCSAPASGGGSSSGSTRRTPLIYNVSVNEDTEQVTVRFHTSSPVFSTLRWGKTQEYSAGIARSTVFVTEHSFFISGLEAGTRYFFSIEGQDRFGRIIVAYAGAFSTLPLPIQAAVPNPWDVRTEIGREGITIRWRNPENEDLDYVRIMKNTDHFHSSTYEGELVYEGRGERAVDREVVYGEEYYYSLFARTYAGNFSSGAGAYTFYNWQAEDAPVVVPPVVTEPAPATDTSLGFIFIQNGKVVAELGREGQADGSTEVRIESEPGAFPSVEDIYMEITGLDGRPAFYILSYEGDRKIYTGSVPHLGVSGNYDIRIYGFVGGEKVLLGEGTIAVSGGGEEPQLGRDVPLWVPFSWLFLLLIGFILWLRKKLRRF